MTFLLKFKTLIYRLRHTCNLYRRLLILGLFGNVCKGRAASRNYIHVKMNCKLENFES